MTMITFDMTILKETYQLLLMIPIEIQKTISARIWPDKIWTSDIQVKVK